MIRLRNDSRTDCFVTCAHRCLLTTHSSHAHSINAQIALQTEVTLPAPPCSAAADGKCLITHCPGLQLREALFSISDKQPTKFVCTRWHGKFCRLTINHRTKRIQHRTRLLISNFRRVLNVVVFLLGDSPAFEFYVPTFRNTVPSS